MGTKKARDEYLARDAFDNWEHAWIARLATEDTKPEDRVNAMQCVNPALIPRTHRIEAAIQSGVQGDFAPFERLQKAWSTPFDLGDFEDLARPPEPDEAVAQTFCGT